MQTFLPYPDIKKSLVCLDFRRLGKQRVEAKQIINALTIPEKGWKNHPATKMWSNNLEALKLYHNIAIETWVERGYKNNMELFDVDPNPEMPWWFGLNKFHASHRSNLLRKDYEFYSRYDWPEDSDLPYFWPL